MRRMPLARAIVYGGQFAHRNLKAGFLPQLPDDALARRLVYVCPPARHRPASGIGDLAHEKNATVLDYRSADIHFWCRVAGLFREQSLHANAAIRSLAARVAFAVEGA